ncbi:alpha/beta hydrolase [Halomonas nitroreducens]|uniref:Alpha/beta fold hydrolase n=1 Tax=Halomonas nitroreducens TaxID=447425 RepID=A0A431V7C5_9GAMM|nr:alpha/beta hydrolase [Halomonas nitroreducens]RTR06926.1 alpha/beta fold hydrolase [Halomonas nitroreducens]
MTRNALERDYSPSRYARDFAATLARQAEEGAALVEAHRPARLRYVDDPAACTDLFLPAGPGPWPLMVFIHGGYWQELDHAATNFLAARYLPRGMAFASLGYGLAPRVSIETMAAQCRQGVRAVTARVTGLGGVDRLVLGGHSAGAQLACRVAAAEAALPTGLTIDALQLVSGVYDLTPLVDTYVNAPLGLDPVRARSLSPLYDDLEVLPPLELLIAEHDTPAFRRQARDFQAAVLAAGGTARLHDLPGCDHFDILDKLGPDREA